MSLRPCVCPPTYVRAYVCPCLCACSMHSACWVCESSMLFKGGRRFHLGAGHGIPHTTLESHTPLPKYAHASPSPVHPPAGNVRGDPFSIGSLTHASYFHTLVLQALSWHVGTLFCGTACCWKLCRELVMTPWVTQWVTSEMWRCFWFWVVGGSVTVWIDFRWVYISVVMVMATS